MIMNIENLIHYAAMAPSGHNTQPWKFSVHDNQIRIHPDFTRRLPVVDPDDHALYISLGCALENLIIAARHEGFSAKVNYFPDDEEYLEVKLTEESSEDDDELFDVIPERQSNRSLYNGESIPDSHLEQLTNVVDSSSTTLRKFYAGHEDAEHIISLVKEANRIQFKDRGFVDELISWIRFSKQEAVEQKDGLTSEAMGFPSVPRWLGKMIIRKFATPEGEAKKCEKMIRSSPVLMVFIAKNQSKKNWVDLGRHFQRAALMATKLGISHAHLNMPCEVESVKEKFSGFLNLKKNEEPLLLIRLGYSKPMPKSPRRNIKEIIKTD